MLPKNGNLLVVSINKIIKNVFIRLNLEYE
jgi:hypothetical protein